MNAMIHGGGKLVPGTFFGLKLLRQRERELDRRIDCHPSPFVFLYIYFLTLFLLFFYFNCRFLF